MFLTPNITAIKKRRIEAGMSMKLLSEKSQLPENAILRIERGETKKTNHLRAKEIAKVLGCEVEELFTPLIKGA